MKNAIRNANMKKLNIDEVVLIGGCTRIPKIQKLLQDFFNDKELNKSIHPDEAVAYDAAIQAGILNGDKHEIIEKLCLFDIKRLSLSIL